MAKKKEETRTEAIVQFTPEPVSLDLAVYEAQAAKLKKLSEKIVVSDDKSAAFGSDLVAEAKDAIKHIEEFRKQKVTPLNNYVDKINAFFKPIVLDFKAVIQVTTPILISYNEQKEKVRQDLVRKQEEEYQKRLEEERKKAAKTGKTPAIVAPPPTILESASIQGAGSSFSIQSFPDYEVEDILAFAHAFPSLVKMEVKRREMLVFLKEEQKNKRADIKIPGIRVFENKTGRTS
jgi:hypothetical protein